MNTRVLGYSYRRLRPDYCSRSPYRMHQYLTEFTANGPGVKDYFFSQFTLVTFRVGICIIRCCLHRGTVTGIIPPDMPLPHDTCADGKFRFDGLQPGFYLVGVSGPLFSCRHRRSSI
jgi:hypothetical protein